MKLRVIAALTAALICTSISPSAFAQDRLSLEEALRRTAAADPTIAAAQARIDAADAQIRQSGTTPNPALALEIENFGGTGDVRGLNQTETTFGVQQEIELGGKRSARIGVARAERQTSAVAAEVARLDLFANVEMAYVEALAAEAEVVIAQERLEVAQSLEKELGRRIASARDPEFAGARTKAQTAEARAALSRAKLAAKAAKAKLASYWGGSPTLTLDQPSFARITIPTVPGEEAITADIRLRERQRTTAAARVDLEQSNAVQDPTIGVGIRHFSERDNVAFMISGSIPLALFDDNKGAIDRAAAERRAADLDLATYRLQWQREALRLRSELEIAANDVHMIEDEIIPEAARAVKLVREGFGRGAFGYLEVSEAQRGLTDARAARIAALRRFHTEKANLERLLGTHASITAKEPHP